MRLLQLLIIGVTLSVAPAVFGQSYGVELHNTVMPASSGMAGTSFTQPQDVQSAIYGNPATMTQFEGTQAAFGGAWAEPTFDITQTGIAPAIGVSPYDAKSQAPGSLVGNIGVLFDSCAMGRPVKLGVGFMTGAGLGVDFRQVPESNGTNTSYLELDLVASAAMQMTDQLSVGATFIFGTGVLNSPFVGISSTSLNYAARGAAGFNYDLGSGTTVGAYWQSKKAHTFYDLVRIGGSFANVEMDLPANTGFGIANKCLMNGRLLLAADVLYKNWSNASFFQSIYDDQWVFQFGGQYIVNPRLRLRSGYAYNTEVTKDTVDGTIGGVIPVGGIPAIQYAQGQFAVTPQHRLTGGVGIRDIMPGIDFDASVGGMFRSSKSFGATTSSVESYWVAFGLTWKCGGSFNSCSYCPPSDQPSLEYTSQIMQ